MSIGPKITKKDPFTQTIRGTFGRFQTSKSHALNYLLSSIPIDEIAELSTASELFTTDAIKFDELIQRDIDQARVARIANDYLVGSNDKIVFFPPLLACIVLSAEGGGIQRRYEEYSEIFEIDGDTRIYHGVWDTDGFELSLALGDKTNAERKMTLADGTQEWFHDAGQIRLNPKRAKLVVLDGQHRLEALRLVKKGPHKDILDNIEVPVCLVFTPKAMSPSSEDMVEDFRELFVRVNEEAKRVSGHFLILLQDDSYAAASIRELAEAWRTNISQGYSLLHLLEWNQRVEEQTRKRSRALSVTTIGIVHDTLLDYVFKEDLASTILQLDEAAKEFAETDANFNYSDVTDQTYGPAIDSIVFKKIREHLVPALSILLLELGPYKRLQSEMQKAFAKLREEVDGHNSSFAALEEYLLKYKYSEEEITENSVKVVLKEFLGWIKIGEKDHLFFLHSFQHGLIRMWIRVSTILSAFGISPTAAANATVASLEALVLLPDSDYLASHRKYGQRMLWRNERVNFSSTAWTRDAWVDILTASFLRKTVVAGAMKSIGEVSTSDKSKIITALQKIGQDAATAYCSRLKKELVRDTKANLSELVTPGMLLNLQALQHGDTDAKLKFENAIQSLAAERYQQATLELSNILEIPIASLSFDQ